MKTTLTQSRLRELLQYDPETGVFVSARDAGRWGRIRAGTPVGWCECGYWTIHVEGRKYRAARLAWLYMTGTWPAGVVDHRDGDKTNNRFGNLRDVTVAVNTQNQRRAPVTNKLGLLGVTKHQGRYRAVIQAGGKSKHIGAFDTPEGAHEAYVAAKRQLHEGCTL